MSVCVGAFACVRHVLRMQKDKVMKRSFEFIKRSSNKTQNTIQLGAPKVVAHHPLLIILR